MPDKIFLKPGQLYFGGDDLMVETILGPCIAIVVWYPKHRQGGMCHFQLPERGSGKVNRKDLDGRYCNEAWAWLSLQSLRIGTLISHAEITLFGGANSLKMPGGKGQNDVGQRNIDYILRLLSNLGIKNYRQDLGGTGFRVIRFNPYKGETWVKRGSPLLQDDSAEINSWP